MNLNFSHIYWSRIINFIIRTYLHDSTLCVLWQDEHQFGLQYGGGTDLYTPLVIIDMQRLNATFESNVYDFKPKARQWSENGVEFDDLMLKLAVSIEKTHCENFLVFGALIPKFAASFKHASIASIWRPMNSKFVFAYYSSEVQANYFDDYLFQDQPDLLFVESIYENATFFELKTNKYVGPRAEHPEQVYLLDGFDAVNSVFVTGTKLFPEKTKNLHGREVTIASFDYRPYAIVDYNQKPNARDVALTDPNLSAVFIDGTELRVILYFCAQYNCTAQIDSSDADDWGDTYPNMTGDGLLGMILNHKADIGIGSVYSWDYAYAIMDMTMYLVRTGITCVVPAPTRQASWFLPVQPFQGTLWAAVVACLCIESLGLMLAYMSENSLHDDDTHSWLTSAGFSCVTTFKLLISQAGNSNARSSTVRVLLFACFLNDLIISSIYGGGLASILTIPSLGEAADTVERLRKHKLKWASNSEAWVTAIRGSDEPWVHELLDNFHPYRDEDLIKMAKTIYMGFTVERLPFGYYAIGEHLSLDVVEKMKVMLEDIYFQFTVGFVPRLWPLLKQFNCFIYNLHSSGYGKFFEHRVVSENMNLNIQRKVKSSMTIDWDELGPTELSIANFVGILLVWILGVFIAIIAFIGELLTHKIQRTLAATTY